MCCIGGWYCSGKKRPHPEMLKGMLLAGRTRGIDATGVAWRAPDDRIMFSKEKEDAKDFIGHISKESWEEIANSPIGLLHNRAKTKGTEWKPENNHPVVAFGWVVVHNGTLVNDDDLFAYHGITRPADVDSIAINMLLSREKKFPDCFRQLTTVSGGCTAAMWNVDHPDEIGIIRLGPNELFMWEWDDILYWSSSPHAGQVLPYRALGSLAFQNTAMLPEDRLLVLGPAQKARTFTLTRSPFTPVKKPVSAPYTTFPASAASSTNSAAATKEPESSGDDGSEWEPGKTSSGSEASTEAKPSFKWEGGDRRFCAINGGAVIKPPPVFEQIPITWFDMFEINRRILKAGPGEPHYVQLKTAYGTWHLKEEMLAFKDGGTTKIVRREFSPAKRMKPFFLDVFGEAVPSFPLGEAAANRGTFDNKFPLEPFWLKLKLGDKSSIETLGYMCPVCGVTLQGREWDEQKLKCRWCKVQSFLAVSSGKGAVDGN